MSRGGFTYRIDCCCFLPQALNLRIFEVDLHIFPLTHRHISCHCDWGFYESSRVGCVLPRFAILVNVN